MDIKEVHNHEKILQPIKQSLVIKNTENNKKTETLKFFTS